MKKILIVLAMLLTFGSCFAEFFYRRGETFTGYIVNCKAQTIEKTTLDSISAKNLFERGTFFFIEDGKVCKVEVLEPKPLKYKPVTAHGTVLYKSNTESNADNLSFHIGKYEKESLKEVIIDYTKKVENNQKLDLSDLLEKIENMEFDD